MTEFEPEGGDLDDVLRRVDPDRWLSSRFIADAQARACVTALYAFDHELARAPRVASNPLIGEMRLAWWREALDEVYGDRPVRRHPTAEALADMVRRHSPSRAVLEAMIDARYRELDPAPMDAAEALDLANDAGGGAAVVAARLLDPSADAELARGAGTVWALRRAGAEPTADLIGRARRDAAKLSVAAFPAAAHAALRPGSDFARRLQITWAVARGRI